MKSHVLKLKITGKKDHIFTLEVYNSSHKCQLIYDDLKKYLTYLDKNVLSELLSVNEYQVLKILTSKKHSGLNVNDLIDVVIIEGFRFIKNEDYSRFIVIDQRGNSFNTFVTDSSGEEIAHLYSDGSYLKKLNGAGFACIIKKRDGSHQVLMHSSEHQSSNLMELMAVISGLSVLSHEHTIQVNTDSRFVIKGMTQWIHYWKFNNWQTASGNKAKYARYWKQAHDLTCNKCIIYRWIKGHSDHFEQSYCDLLAREIAAKKVLFI